MLLRWSPFSPCSFATLTCLHYAASMGTVVSAVWVQLMKELLHTSWAAGASSAQGMMAHGDIQAQTPMQALQKNCSLPSRSRMGLTAFHWSARSDLTAVRAAVAGHVVFHGPREQVLPFFAGLGFRLPGRKGIADFLQEVTSKKDQRVSRPSPPLHALWLQLSSTIHACGMAS